MSDSTTPTTSIGRGRGRPKIGTPVTTRLNEDDLKLAIALGDGVEAHGIRLAVRVAASLGIIKAKEIAKAIDERERQASQEITLARVANRRSKKVLEQEEQEYPREAQYGS